MMPAPGVYKRNINYLVWLWYRTIQEFQGVSIVNGKPIKWKDVSFYKKYAETVLIGNCLNQKSVFHLWQVKGNPIKFITFKGKKQILCTINANLQLHCHCLWSGYDNILHLISKSWIRLWSRITMYYVKFLIHMDINNKRNVSATTSDIRCQKNESM